jgi:hypothetical protein
MRGKDITVILERTSAILKENPDKDVSPVELVQLIEQVVTEKAEQDRSKRRR